MALYGSSTKPVHINILQPAREEVDHGHGNTHKKYMLITMLCSATRERWSNEYVCMSSS